MFGFSGQTCLGRNCSIYQSLCFVSVCHFRQREKTEESPGQAGPVPRGKKRLSGSYQDDSKSAVAGLHQTSEPTTPQTRSADETASSEVK